MRYLSLHLPFLATDRIRRQLACDRPRERSGEDDTPALVTFAKVKNAFRLAAVDARAFSLGLCPGRSLADARAMHPTLSVHDADPEGDKATRDAITDWCRLFTPLAAVDGEDGVVLEITGVAHLFGGETALMKTLMRRLAVQGFVSHVAIADTPVAAWALARFGNSHRPRRLEEGLDPDACAKIFAPMPLAALRLGPEIIAPLGQAGLRRIDDLLLRPRAPIAARFGSHILHRLDLLLGRARDPISPRFEAPPYIAERRFAEGLARHEDIEATILALAHDLCGLLACHGEGARRLDVALYRVDGVVKHIEAGTSRPLRQPQAIARLFHERIDAAGEDGLDTGYGFDVIRLAALVVERLDVVQSDWAVTARDENALADLVDRLGARFGFRRVTRIGFADTYRPEHAAPAVSAAAKLPHRRLSEPVAQTDFEALPERPIRLLAHPELIETVAEVPDGPPMRFSWRRVTHHVAAIEGPERIGPEWWKPGQGEATRTRDYFRAEDTDGRRFWLYREGLYREAATPRWFMHGFFA